MIREMRQQLTLDKFPKYFLTVLSNILGYALYFVSFLIPRKKDIWVFGSWSGKRFGDNSKYLFLYVANNHKTEIKSIWISKDKNIVRKLRHDKYNAYYAYDLKGIYYNLRAKYIFSDHYFDSVNFWCCGRATKIQLWHGAEFKKIEYDAKNLPWNKPLIRLLYYFVVPWAIAKNDYIISASDMFIDIYTSAFRIKKERIIVTGLPRNDIIFYNNIRGYGIPDISTYDKIAKIKSNNSTVKFILYLPTFRGLPIRDSNSDNSNGFINFDFDKLDHFLDKVNGFFIIKLHPIIEIDLKRFNQWNRIIFLPSSIDIFPLLNQVDILITDYSSIYYDFLLINRPIIFFPYDLKDYIEKDRGFYFDYGEFTPGPKAFTFVELLYWINYFINNNDDFVDIRKKIKDKCFKYKDGESSYRIYNFIKNKV